MTAIKRIMLIATIMTCAAVWANADGIPYDFTDLGVGHDWDTEANWDPEGTPGEEDTATIPDGLTCEIALANQSIRELIVDDGGKLEVTGRTLTIGIGGSPSIRLDGDTEFFGQAYLETSQCFLSIRGGGEMSCTGSGNLLTIRKPTGSYPLLMLGYLPPPPEPGPTIKGNVTILADIDIRKGRLLVDAPGDVMTIGTLVSDPPYAELSGSKWGAFEVKDGHMKFGHCRPRWPSGAFECVWLVDGGRLELTEYANAVRWLEAKHPVSVISGTLEFSATMITSGGISFSGGQIKVVHPYLVIFTHPSE